MEYHYPARTSLLPTSALPALALGVLRWHAAARWEIARWGLVACLFERRTRGSCTDKSCLELGYNLSPEL